MILLDTCVFVWLGLDKEKISKRALEQIEKEELAVSCISFLEIGQLVRKGRLEIPCETSEFLNLVCETFRISPLTITPQIVATAMAFPPSVNSDPADRIISATAIDHGCHLITRDANLRECEVVPTFW